jgi:hypothetical protein
LVSAFEIFIWGKISAQRKTSDVSTEGKRRTVFSHLREQRFWIENLKPQTLYRSMLTAISPPESNFCCIAKEHESFD